MTLFIKDKSWPSLCQYSWVKDMHGVPQSPVHHAEGDVAIHTQMVLAELTQLSEYQNLPNNAQELIWVAALMHDIEKRSTTRTEENGDIVSPGHAKKGAQTARQLLYRELPTSFAERLQITALVRHHGLPLWALEKEDPAKAVIKASLEVNTEWLYILAKADALGRICSDQKDLLDRLGYFKELCLEQDCWGKPKAFPSNLAKFSYFRKEGQSPDFLPFDNMAGEVLILSGIAGSGKDFYLSRKHAGLPVISLDDMRRKMKIDRNDTKGNGHIIQEAIAKAKVYLRAGEPFAWNATNITSQMRERLIDQFAVYRPRIKVVYIEVSYAKLLTQNARREHPIPAIAIENMIDKLEVPRVWEAHEVTYLVG